MTPQELKNSILQLAIQGKLVDQRPEEGTAEDLYRKIQAQKAALIKAGKIKKEKPLPEITEDEKPFDIPESWKWVRFGECGVLKSGFAFKSTEYCPSGIQVVRISDLDDNTIGNKNAVYYPYSDSLSSYLISANSFLICLTGSIGKMAWVQDSIPRYLNQRVGMYEPSNCCEAGYLWWFLHTGFVINQWIGAKTSTNGNIKNSDVTELVFPLPPLAEQKRIVTKIEELLPLIDRYEQAWTRLETFNKRFPGDMQKSLLQLAIQGKLVEQCPEEGTGEDLYRQIQAEKQSLIRFGKLKKDKPLPPIPDDELPFDIPESWKWAHLLSVVTIATNLVSPAHYMSYQHIAPDNIEKGTGKLLECKTVLDDKVSSANHLFFKGQVIYSKIRPLLRKAVIAPFDGLCSADMYPLSTELDSKFVLYYLLSDAYNHQIASAMSSRVKMPKINQDELAKVLIPIPPLAEQKRIVAKLESLLPLCDKLK